MTPDTCPFCRASKRYAACAGMEYSCGSWAADYSCGSWAADNGAKVQSDNCARYVRTQISQLKRMARCADQRMNQLLDLDAEDNGFSQGFYWRWYQRFARFHFSCLREIDRLRGAP